MEVREGRMVVDNHLLLKPNKNKQKNATGTQTCIPFHTSFPYSVASYWSANWIQGDGGQEEGDQHENQIFQVLSMFYSNLIKLLNSLR